MPLFTLVCRNWPEVILCLSCGTVLLTGCQQTPSEAELQQYQSLTETLDLVNQRASRSSKTVAADLQEQVERNNWVKQDVAVLQAAQKVQSRTAQLTAFLQQLRQRLRTASGSPQDMGATAPVEAIMLSPSGGGTADSLQRRLNDYALYIKQHVPSARPLALDVRDDMLIRESLGGDWNKQRFGEFYFGGVPVASALVTLEQQEAWVRLLEKEALMQLRQRVGTSLFFHKLGAWAVPESETVREGETYRATLMLTTSTNYRMTMQANGQPVPVGPEGIGRVAFDVPADAPAGSAFWEGMIRTRYRGQDTTFQVRVPYTVRSK